MRTRTFVYLTKKWILKNIIFLWHSILIIFLFLRMINKNDFTWVSIVSNLVKIIHSITEANLGLPKRKMMHNSRWIVTWLWWWISCILDFSMLLFDDAPLNSYYLHFTQWILNLNTQRGKCWTLLIYENRGIEIEMLEMTIQAHRDSTHTLLWIFFIIIFILFQFYQPEHECCLCCLHFEFRNHRILYSQTLCKKFHFLFISLSHI